MRLKQPRTVAEATTCIQEYERVHGDCRRRRHWSGAAEQKQSTRAGSTQDGGMHRNNAIIAVMVMAQDRAPAM